MPSRSSKAPCGRLALSLGRRNEEPKAENQTIEEDDREGLPAEQLIFLHFYEHLFKLET